MYSSSCECLAIGINYKELSPKNRFIGNLSSYCFGKGILILILIKLILLFFKTFFKKKETF